MQNISDKSRDTLYDAVHNDIMDTRVKINTLLVGTN